MNASFKAVTHKKPKTNLSKYVFFLEKMKTSNKQPVFLDKDKTSLLTKFTKVNWCFIRNLKIVKGVIRIHFTLLSHRNTNYTQEYGRDIQFEKIKCNSI